MPSGQPVTIGIVRSAARVAAGGRLRPRPAELLGLAGLLVAVAGTFLPWLRSGATLRNSYELVAVARRLTSLGDGPVGVALGGWPAVGVLAAGCTGLYALGWRRCHAAATAILGVLVGTVATIAVVILPAGDSAIGVVAAGPLVTLAGAAMAVLGALVAYLPGQRSDVTRTAGGAQ